MTVGTQGTVKGVLPDQIERTGAQIILANTYHLMLRPGSRTVAELGGLHRFMGWDKPILTDSGGFQVFSLSKINEVSDEGVTFQSHIDGTTVHLTPEKSIEVQNDLGADIIMAFDECPDPNREIAYQRVAVDRTVRWMRQCVAAHRRPDEQALFAIVQGGTDLSLRKECAQALVAMDLPGYGIGGLAVGEGFETMLQVIEHTAPLLPEDKPRYLMGVGFPRDIVEAVARGVDMFDCVIPTRHGRNAYAFTSDGPVRLRNSQHRSDPSPLEAGCDCFACGHFSRGAIRHYFSAGEMLGPILVSVHNMRFYQRLMADVRRSIEKGRFDEFRRTDARCRLGPQDGGGAKLERSDESDTEPRVQKELS
jgi:queuine tRNA-ribosyltransferase